MAFISPSFTELIITQEKFVGICCKELYPNRTKTVENRDQTSFTSFGKESFSLHRLSLTHNYSVTCFRRLGAGLPSCKPGFVRGPFRVRFVEGNLAMEQAFSSTSLFPCQYQSTRGLYPSPS